MTAARGKHFGLPVANRFALSRQHKDDFAIACVLVHTYRRVRFEPARNKFYVRLIEHFKPSRAFSVAKAIGAFFAYSFKMLRTVVKARNYGAAQNNFTASIAQSL